MAPLLTEEESAVDPYTALGLESGAAEGEIKKAYRKMSLKYHPDKNPTAEGAVMFRKISIALAILTDSAKRTYIDTRLEADRKKRERYAEMNKKQKEMVDALHAREEEARLAKIQAQKRKREETEEESIKEAGRRMLEEAQKRAAAAAASSAAHASASGRTNGARAQHGDSGASQTNGAKSTMPPISPADLSLILTIPSTVPTSDLEQRITATYGPLAHFILKPPPAESKDAGKKKGKAWKAVVEFEKGNWGGCWACWKDHQKDSPRVAPGGNAPGLGDGVRAKWVGGEEPAWVAWASQTGGSGPAAPSPSSNGLGSTARQGGNNGTTLPDAPFSATFPDPFAHLGDAAAPPAPSFGSAPDFGSTTMADLLASHASSKAEKEEHKRKAEEFESMTLFQMRQRERERLAAQIRAEEGEE